MDIDVPAIVVQRYYWWKSQCEETLRILIDYCGWNDETTLEVHDKIKEKL